MVEKAERLREPMGARLGACGIDGAPGGPGIRARRTGWSMAVSNRDEPAARMHQEDRRRDIRRLQARHQPAEVVGDQRLDSRRWRSPVLRAAASSRNLRRQSTDRDRHGKVRPACAGLPHQYIRGYVVVRRQCIGDGPKWGSKPLLGDPFGQRLGLGQVEQQHKAPSAARRSGRVKRCSRGISGRATRGFRSYCSKRIFGPHLDHVAETLGGDERPSSRPRPAWISALVTRVVPWDGPAPICEQRHPPASDAASAIPARIARSGRS